MRIFWATVLAVVAGVAGGWVTRGHERALTPLPPKTQEFEALGGSDDLATDDAGDYHVSAGADTFYPDNPPTSGPQYAQWAPWRAFERAVPRGVWVHNLAHGGIALLYRPDARLEVLAALRQAYAALPPDQRCGHAWAVMTPDPELDPEWAVVAWGHVLTAHDVDEDAVLRFALAHRGEHDARCAQGSWTR
jgi:hypothetical protein